MNIIFIASETPSQKQHYEIADSEWGAWKAAAAKASSKCTVENDSKIIINWSSFDVTIIIIKRSAFVDAHFDPSEGNERTAENVKNAVQTITDVDPDEIYIHRGKKSTDKLLQLDIKAGDYSANHPDEPLFKAVVDLITKLNNQNYEAFCGAAKNIWKQACIKPLCDEIKVLSFSLLLDVAIYEECEEDKRQKCLHAIPVNNTKERLDNTYSQLSEAVTDTQESIKQKLDMLCTQSQAILLATGNGNIKEVHRSYSELTKLLEKLYAN